MNKKAEDKIRRLSTNQANALKSIIFSPITSFASNATLSGYDVSNMTGLAGRQLGGTVSALERNNIIQPLGRENRQFNWQVTDPDILEARKEDPKTLLEMLEQIGGKK